MQYSALCIVDNIMVVTTMYEDRFGNTFTSIATIVSYRCNIITSFDTVCIRDRECICGRAQVGARTSSRTGAEVTRDELDEILDNFSDASFRRTHR